MNLAQRGDRDITDVALVDHRQGRVRNALHIRNQAQRFFEDCGPGIDPRTGRVDRRVLDFRHCVRLALGRVDKRDDVRISLADDVMVDTVKACQALGGKVFAE